MRFPTFFWYPWNKEIVNTLLGAGILIAIAVLLKVYDNGEQPRLLSAISLNTLVAILATLLRWILMSVVEEVLGQLKWVWFRRTRPLVDLAVFDKAARGPLGAFKFLITLPRVNLATLGALISVVSLATSALTQQAIQTVPCLQAEPDTTASISLSQVANGTLSAQSVLGAPGITITLSGVDVKTQAAAVNGISRLQAITPAPVDCPTGNCTFPEIQPGISYTTLGVSSGCVDISSKIEQTNYADYINYTIAGAGNLNFYYNTTRQQQTRASNGSLVNTEVIGEWSSVLNVTAMQLQTTGADTSLLEGLGAPTSTLGLSSAPWYVVMMMPTLNQSQSFQTLSLTDDSVYSGSCKPHCNETTAKVTSLPEYFGLTASACWLYPSIINMRGEVSNGELVETQVGDAIPLTMVNSSAYGFREPCYIGNELYEIGDSSTWPNRSVASFSFLNASSRQEIMGPQECFYGLDSTSYEGLLDLEFLFFFTMAASNSFQDFCRILSNDEKTMSCEISWWLDSLWNAGNASIDSFREAMQSTAQAVTNRIRTGGVDINGNAVVARGTALQSSVCIRANWPWLLFPAIMVLATAVLLIVVIIWDLIDTGAEAAAARHHGKTPVWKTEMLPLLLYGLEEREKYGELLDRDQLAQVAKGIEVSFRSGSGAEGWRFTTGKTTGFESDANFNR